MIKLERPQVNLFSSYMRFISERADAGEKIWDEELPREGESPESFVARILDEETNPEGSRVPATVLWATSGELVVGKISLRHKLNNNLKEFGGHIGYDVIPSRRRQGIATFMLKELLTYPKAKEIGQLLLTCAPDNIASNKTIIANGGVLEATKFVERINRHTNYYWINLKK